MESMTFTHLFTNKYLGMGNLPMWLYGSVMYIHGCAGCCVADSAEVSRMKVTVEPPHSSVKMRAMSQVPVISPEDDLTAVLLQVLVMSLLIFNECVYSMYMLLVI